MSGSYIWNKLRATAVCVLCSAEHEKGILAPGRVDELLQFTVHHTKPGRPLEDRTVCQNELETQAWSPTV